MRAVDYDAVHRPHHSNCPLHEDSAEDLREDQGCECEEIEDMLYDREMGRRIDQERDE